MSKTKTRHPNELEAIQDETDTGSNGDLKAIVKFVSKGVTITVVQDTKGLTLHQAVRSGNEDLVKSFVEEKPQAILNSRDEYGITLLHIAAKNGHRRVAKVLVDGGAAIDSKDKFGTTALHVAAKNGYEGVIEVLVNAGATVDTEDMYGWTPLSSALLKDYSSVVRYLINVGKADRHKVKYQFQNRIAALLIEEDSVEPASDNTQQAQSKFVTGKESTPARIHHDSTQQRSLEEPQERVVEQKFTCTTNGDGGQEFKEHLQTAYKQVEQLKRSSIDQRQPPSKEVLDTKQLTKGPRAKQFPKPVGSRDDRHSPIGKQLLNSEHIPAIGPNMVMIVDTDNHSVFPRRSGIYKRQQALEETAEDFTGVRQLRQPSVELGDNLLPRKSITNDENKPPLNYKKKKTKKRHWLKRFW